MGVAGDGLGGPERNRRTVAIPGDLAKRQQDRGQQGRDRQGYGLGQHQCNTQHHKQPIAACSKTKRCSCRKASRGAARRHEERSTTRPCDPTQCDC